MRPINQTMSCCLSFPSCPPLSYGTQAHLAPWHGSVDEHWVLKHKPLAFNCMAKPMHMSGYESGCFFHTTHESSQMSMYVHCLLPCNQMHVLLLCNQNAHSYMGMVGRGMGNIQGPQSIMLKCPSMKIFCSLKFGHSWAVSITSILP